MKTMDLLEGLQFRERTANSQPLYVDANGRILRFTLKPGQRINEHNAPHSPLYIIVLKGTGVFTGGEGVERQVGPNTVLIFDPGENHSVRALDKELVFIGILHGVPGARPDKTGGVLGEG